jgi:hypothetical protein
MRSTLAVLVLLAAVVTAWPRPASAQSLADVARQEGERRKALENDGKTLTNADLGPGASSAPATASDATKSDEKTDKDKADDKDKPADAAKKDDKAKDQKYWADRMKGLNGKLAEDKVLADAVQSRINALTADFVNRDDPAQRAVIASDKQKAVDELARLKQSVVEDTKAIADTEEEARKAGVPPGWLR